MDESALAPPPVLPLKAGLRVPTRQALDDVVAGALAALLVGVAVLTALAAAVPELAGAGTVVSRWRLLMTLLLAGGALGALWLRRAGRPRAASVAAMAMLLLAAGAHAAVTGVGLHSLALAGAAIAVGLAGVLGSTRIALALGALDAAIVTTLYLVEREGLIGGAALDAEVHGLPGLVAHLLLVACGLVAALVIGRLVADSVARAAAGERRLADLLDVTSDWVWQMDRQGRLVDLSPSFEARTGRSVAEFLRLGQPGGPQIVQDAGYAALVAALQARRPFRDCVMEFRCADGERLAVLGCGEPQFDAEGRFVGWWGVSRNITGERDAQRELDRSRALLDKLVHLSPDAICVARLSDGRILLANPAFLSMAEVTPDAVVGRSALEIGLWRDPAEPARLLALLQREGVVRNMASLVWVSGQHRDVLLSAAAFDSDGAPVAVITVRDITGTERARLEGDAILDNASVGIAFVRARRFERINPQFEAMFGHGPGSLAGQPTSVLFPDAPSYAEFARRAEGAYRAGRTIDIEREVPRPDGSVVLARLRARTVDPARPIERGSIWVAEDITERRRAERELAEAKAQAEAGSQAKSAFLATMSHEIRTPLNGVLGLARLLQDETLDAGRRRQYVGYLMSSAEQLAGIVSDVLDLSKIEAGHLQLESIVFDLHGVVASTFGSFESLGRERGLAMRCTIAEGVPRRVRGDPVRVRQILANYLGNAVKFTERGEVAVQVLAVAAGRIRLEVHDTGEGIAPELEGRLFKPFSQADGSTTRRFGGTGLGLSICRELADRMGGAVGVEAGARGGSCFWADLPLPAEGPPAAGSPAEPGATAARPLAGLHVLVAEDNPVNMLIVGTMLRHLGAVVHEAEDGARAVALAMDARQPVHAVLMDLHMPTLDGLSATRRLREAPGTTALPVFALSAAVLDNERSEAEAAGMNGFVTKPVVEAELLRVLQPLVGSPVRPPPA